MAVEKVFLHLSVPVTTRERLWTAVNKLRNADHKASMSSVVDAAVTVWLKHQHMPPDVTGKKDKLMVRVRGETREQIVVAISNLQLKAKTLVSMSAIVDEAINHYLDDKGIPRMAKTFHFTGEHFDSDASVELGTYQDGSIALRLRGLDGIPLATPTVNLDAYDEHPKEGNVFVKGYGDGEGMYEALRANGIVGQKIRTVKYGDFDAHAYECEFTLPRSDAHLL